MRHHGELGKDEARRVDQQHRRAGALDGPGRRIAHRESRTDGSRGATSARRMPVPRTTPAIATRGGPGRESRLPALKIQLVVEQITSATATGTGATMMPSAMSVCTAAARRGPIPARHGETPPAPVRRRPIARQAQ